MWKVILMVTLRAVRSGVITGVLLAVARMSGETAPLLFTALNNQFWSADMNAPMANLPVVIFQFAMSPVRGLEDRSHGRRRCSSRSPCS
jgi:phosphate transport system permease protein